MLKNNRLLQEKLYVNGFLITEASFEITDSYPFYNNWNVTQAFGYQIYTHKMAKLTLCRANRRVFFMIGHAVDPFAKLSDDTAILRKIADSFQNGESAYQVALNDLTGVFCTGILSQNGLLVSNDCAGMQIVYYGRTERCHCVASHSKLAADLLGLERSEYIDSLVASRFYHYMGTWLPGDLSPYPALRRLLPNHFARADGDGNFAVSRFFPLEALQSVNSETEYENTIEWLSEVLHQTLELYVQKWPDRRLAISVTGGRDSTTTLACAKGLYDGFQYFSYISNEAERVDAEAAQRICERLGLRHETYVIPENDAELPDLDSFAAVLECNAGCIGKNNLNDVRKRLWFIREQKYDIEIKSWVNELGRGSQYVKYGKKRFPKRPTASWCRALYKVLISPRLIHRTDQVFNDYLQTYYPEEVLQKAPWMELFWWEFCWSGGEGIFLTAEHRTSSEIAIPFNNRRYVAKMLTVPLERRKADAIPIDIIQRMNPEIAKAGPAVRNLKHTNKRAVLMRAYLELFSRLRF